MQHELKTRNRSGIKMVTSVECNFDMAMVKEI